MPARRKASHGSIYVIENISNGKKYVGQTINDPIKRLYGHKGAKTELGNDIRCLGKNRFLMHEFHGIPISSIDFFEQQMIAKSNSIVPNGYNLEPGGYENRLMSENTRKRLSIAAKGRTPWNKGKKLSPEHAAKCRIANLGKKASPETRALLSRMRMGNKYLLGKKQSDEHKLNISKALKGKVAGENNGAARMVRCVETGEVFGAIILAKNKYSKASHIVEVCKGTIKTSGGFHWEYYEGQNI